MSHMLIVIDNTYYEGDVGMPVQAPGLGPAVSLIFFLRRSPLSCVGGRAGGRGGSIDFPCWPCFCAAGLVVVIRGGMFFPIKGVVLIFIFHQPDFIFTLSWTFLGLLAVFCHLLFLLRLPPCAITYPFVLGPAFAPCERLEHLISSYTRRLRLLLIARRAWSEHAVCILDFGVIFCLRCRLRSYFFQRLPLGSF